MKRIINKQDIICHMMLKSVRVTQELISWIAAVHNRTLKYDQYQKPIRYEMTLQLSEDNYQIVKLIKKIIKYMNTLQTNK